MPKDFFQKNSQLLIVDSSKRRNSVELPPNWQQLPALKTAYAAIVLNKKPQTLRIWASTDTGPLDARPVRVGRELLWCTQSILRVLDFNS